MLVIFIMLRQTQPFNDLPRVGRIVHAHGVTSLVIILIADGISIFTDKPKCDPPISTD